MAEQSEPVTLIATFRATSGQHETVLGLISEYGKAVRQEPGNIFFDIYTEQEDPHGFVIFEQYRDQSAFHAHLGGDTGKIFNETLAPLIEGDGSELQFLRIASQSPVG